MMAKQLQIAQSKHADQSLTKTQKQFNRLVQNLTRLKSTLEEVRELDVLTRRLGETQILPAEKTVLGKMRDLTLALHHSPHFSDLKPKEASKFDQIVLENLDVLLNSPFYTEDEELKQMFEDYHNGEQSFEEILKEGELQAFRETSEMMHDMFGLELDEEDFFDPGKLEEKLKAKQAEFEEQARLDEEKRAKRKKTPAQVEREAKQNAAATALNKTIKSIYHDLVRHFHPDKEPDETKRAAKTETMKQITAAYEAGDHLQLLQLQMNLLADRDNVFASFSDQDLSYFNKILQQQVYDLQDEIESATPPFNGNPFGRIFGWSNAEVNFNVQLALSELKTEARQLDYTVQSIRTLKGFRSFIKNFQLREEENFFF